VRQPGGHISALAILFLVQFARALYLWNTAGTDRQTILFAFSGIDLDVNAWGLVLSWLLPVISW
jgi:hypothetical protein